MARLILATAYAVGSTILASASPMAIAADDVIRVTNATLSQKQSNPSASGSINSAIRTSEAVNNSSEEQVYLVNETIAALITASA